MFVVKAEYRGVTRKFTFAQEFPSWDDLCAQLYKVFRIDSYFIRLLSIGSVLNQERRTPIGQEAHSAVQYDRIVAPFRMTHARQGVLKILVCDHRPRKEPVTSLSSASRRALPRPPLNGNSTAMDIDSSGSHPHARGPGNDPSPLPQRTSTFGTNSGSEMSTAPSSVSVQEEVGSMIGSFIAEINSTLARHGLSESLTLTTTYPPPPPPVVLLSEDIEMGSSETPRAPVAVSSLGEIHPGVWCDMCQQPLRGTRFKCLNCVNYDLCESCVSNKDATSRHSAGLGHLFDIILPASSSTSVPAPVQLPSSPVSVSVPLQAHPKSKASPFHVHRARCDVCNDRVIGLRFKCKTCPDYDMCSDCYTNFRGAHRLEHVFESITGPQNTSSTSRNTRNTPRPSSLSGVDLLLNMASQPTSLASAPTLGPRGMPSRNVSAPIPPMPTTVRHNAYCDNCQSKISGVRHTCMGCPDFDLCSDCLPTARLQHNANHKFYPLSTTGPLPHVVNQARAALATHNAFCDGCHMKIRGPRHVCVHCRDFDFCASCYAARGTVRHNPSHQFCSVEKAGPLPEWIISLRKANVPSLSLSVPTSIIPLIPTIPVPPVEPLSMPTVAPSAPPVPPFLTWFPAVPMPPLWAPPSLQPPPSYVVCDACGDSVDTRQGAERFKCLDCPYVSYDLCATCHASPEKRQLHDADHTFYHIPAGTEHVVLHHVYDEDTPAQRTSVSTASTATSSAHTPTVAGAEHQAICDVCHTLVKGTRWKCVDCDYDSCSACLPVARTQHIAGHQFLDIKEPGEVVIHRVAEPEPAPAPEASAVPSQATPPASVPAPPVLHNANCDLCESQIEGVRFKCTRCPDFDVCESCFGITSEHHPHHAFAKVKALDDLTHILGQEQFTTVHPAVCNECKTHIIGVRYKCLHPACTDFDLCAHCEALPIPVHPFNHPLVKFKHDFVEEQTGYERVFDFVRNGGLRASISRSTSETLSASSSPTVTPKLDKGKGREIVEDEEIVDNVATPNMFAAVPTLISETQRLEHSAMSTQRDYRTPPSPPFTMNGYMPHTRLPESVAVDAPVSHVDPSEGYTFEPVPEMMERRSTPPVSLPVLRRNASILATPDAALVEHNNLSPGYEFPPGAEFVKSWRMRNTGQVAWPVSTVLKFVGGERMGEHSSVADAYPVGRVEPGEEVDVHAFDMKAPEEAGSYTGTWRLADSEKTVKMFGEEIYCEIIVDDTPDSSEGEMSSSAMMMPASAPIDVPPTPVEPVIENVRPESPISAVSTGSLASEFESAVSLTSHSDSAWEANTALETQTFIPARRESGEFVLVEDEDAQSEVGSEASLL